MFSMQKRMTEVKREKSRGKKVSLSSYLDFSGPASTPMREELIGDGGSFLPTLIVIYIIHSILYMLCMLFVHLFTSKENEHWPSPG